MVVVVIAIMITPGVVAVLVPSARAVHGLVVTAQERIAIMVALPSGDRRMAILRIVVGVHLSMPGPIVAGGFNPLVERAATNIIVVVWRLNVPLNYLRMRVAGTTHWHTCQAEKDYWSYETNCTFHGFPRLRLMTSQTQLDVHKEGC